MAQAILFFASDILGDLGRAGFFRRSPKRSRSSHTARRLSGLGRCGNFVDGQRSGGMASNRTQTVNVAISAITTVAVVPALNAGMGAVLAVFGAWAIVSGVLQLGTAVRRWKHFGAQWVMILSGAQSALAGLFFLAQRHAAAPQPIGRIAGYAAVGAIYFLISAIWLQVRQTRRKVS